MSLLSREYRVHWGLGRDVTLRRDGDVLLTFDWEALVVLHYLNTGDGEPLKGDWVPFRTFPAAKGGYSDSFEKRAVRPLVERFGEDLEGFVGACRADGGEPVGLAADGAFFFNFLPRLPIAVLLWVQDDEFPARASILYDASASHYLPVEDLTVAASILVSRLKKAAPA